MLFAAAVINGIVAVPIMFAMMLVVSGGRGAQRFGLPRWLKILGWVTTLLMAATLGVFVWSNLS